jgi:AcrR family transcriptional regulator
MHQGATFAMSTTKRAYSEEARQERETSIINSAERLLLERGYFAINMDQVARTAGLAKGTVYLYFKTKEELFLTVFERQAVVWFDEIEQTLSESVLTPSREALADLLVHSLADKLLLTRLVALSTVLFEYNVSLERAHAHKVWIFQKLAMTGKLIDEKFNLSQGQGVELLFRTFIIVAGLEGFTHLSPIMEQVYETEPTLTKLDFGTELRSLLLMILQAPGG